MSGGDDIKKKEKYVSEKEKLEREIQLLQSQMKGGKVTDIWSNSKQQENVNPTPIVKKTITAKQVGKFGTKTVCTICDKRVYPMDLVEFQKRSYHKTCFACTTCKKKLTMANVSIVGDTLFCLPHFKEMFSEGGGKYDFTGISEEDREKRATAEVYPTQTTTTSSSDAPAAGPARGVVVSGSHTAEEDIKSCPSGLVARLKQQQNQIQSSSSSGLNASMRNVVVDTEACPSGLVSKLKQQGIGVQTSTLDNSRKTVVIDPNECPTGLVSKLRDQGIGVQSSSEITPRKSVVINSEECPTGLVSKVKQKGIGVQSSAEITPRKSVVINSEECPTGLVSKIKEQGIHSDMDTSRRGSVIDSNECPTGLVSKIKEQGIHSDMDTSRRGSIVIDSDECPTGLVSERLKQSPAKQQSEGKEKKNHINVNENDSVPNSPAAVPEAATDMNSYSLVDAAIDDHNHASPEPEIGTASKEQEEEHQQTISPKPSTSLSPTTKSPQPPKPIITTTVKPTIKAPKTPTRTFGTKTLCTVCDKRVYPMELVKFESKSFHKNCFVCCHCNKKLTMKNFAVVNDKIFCKTHFKELFSEGGGRYSFTGRNDAVKT